MYMLFVVFTPASAKPHHEHLAQMSSLFPCRDFREKNPEYGSGWRATVDPVEISEAFCDFKGRTFEFGCGTLASSRDRVPQGSELGTHAVIEPVLVLPDHVIAKYPLPV